MTFFPILPNITNYLKYISKQRGPRSDWSCSGLTLFVIEASKTFQQMIKADDFNP